VLQHGFTSTLKTWYLYDYVKALRGNYRLVLVDARGHGASDKPHDPRSYSPSLRAGDIVAVLDKLDVDSAHFWGYSMGGRIGFGLAKHAPERVGTLVIGGMHAYERRLSPPARLDGTDPDAFIASLLERWGIDPAALSSGARKELFANDCQALAAAQRDEPSMEEMLPGMAMPCLLYAGEKDPYYSGAQACAKVIPNAVFVGLRGLDHGSAFRRAVLILPRVMEFLRDTSDARR
jgi:pimeloyl-ACP methyl ester carboxylesterase